MGIRQGELNLKDIVFKLYLFQQILFEKFGMHSCHLQTFPASIKSILIQNQYKLINKPNHKKIQENVFLQNYFYPNFSAEIALV